MVFKCDSEYKILGKNNFIDSRGAISNFDLTQKINLIATITSKKNTLRSNHYHPIQTQECLLIKGQYISIYKDLKNKNSLKETHLINQGELVVTKPNVAHTMIFTRDTVFVNLVKGDRDHKNYGKTHTIPYLLINEKEKEFLAKYYKFSCRICDKNDFYRLLSLGYQPFANNFLKRTADIEKYPLEVNICKNCYNAQLSTSPDLNKIYKNYLYRSSVSKEFTSHFYFAAKKYIKLFKLKKNNLIVDIGSNDGIALMQFKNMGFKNILGIEPSKRLSLECKKKGIKIINDFFKRSYAIKNKSKADLILATNVFAHNDNLSQMLKNIMLMLKKDGKIVIEVQYFIETLKKYSFDNIYHEHFNYWTLTALNNFFLNHACKIFKAEKINTHGGSLRIYATKNFKKKIQSSVKSIIAEEKSFGLFSIKKYFKFKNKINNIKDNFSKNIIWLKKKYPNLVGYGASAKSTVAINFFKLEEGYLNYMIDDNASKQNHFIPGTKIKILKINKLPKRKIDCILVFAWNNFEEIKSNNINISNKFVSVRDLYKNDFINSFR